MGDGGGKGGPCRRPEDLQPERRPTRTQVKRSSTSPLTSRSRNNTDA